MDERINAVKKSREGPTKLLEFMGNEIHEFFLSIGLFYNIFLWMTWKNDSINLNNLI